MTIKRYCLVLFVLASTASAQRLIGQPSSRIKEMEIGRTFSVACEPQSNQPAIDLKWYGPVDYHLNSQSERNLIKTQDQMPDQENGSPSRISVQPEGANLRLLIEKIRTTDAGIYNCTGRVNNIASHWSFELKTFSELVVEAETDQYIVKGKDSTIQCLVTAQPAPTVNWLFNKTPISYEGSKYEWKPEQGLTVYNVEDTDVGLYKCQGIDSRGIVEFKEIHVEVVTEPQFTSRPTGGIGIRFGSGQLKCQASGKPKPQYKWYSGTQDAAGVTEITSANNDGRFHPDPTTGDLNILNVQLEDENWYWCEAYNRAGLIKSGAFLDVQMKPIFNDGYNVNNTLRKVGDAIELRCQSRAEPSSNMTFRRTDRGQPYVMGTQPDDSRIHLKQYTVPEATENERIRNEELVMTITNASTHDTANYSCIASNIAYTNKSQQHIIVRHRPSFELTPESYGRQCVWRNNVRNVTLLMTGYGQPSVTWTRSDGNAINSADKDFRSYKVYLEPFWNNDRPDEWMANLQFNWTSAGDGFGPSGSSGPYSPLGNYRVQSSNNEGDSSYTVRVVEADFPLTPNNLTLVDRTAQTLTFSVEIIKSSNCLPVTHVVIEFQRAGSNDPPTTKQFEIADSGRMRLEQLSAGASYSIVVYATNERGYNSERAIRTTYTTDRATSPSPVPISSDPQSLDGTKYLLVWSKPEFDGGKSITEYIIQYRAVGKGEWRKLTKDSSTYSTTITDLDADTRYEVKIQARNQIGLSEVPETLFTFSTERTGKEELVRRAEIPELPYIILVGALCFVVLLLAIDMMCYCSNNCGLLSCMCGGLKHPPPRELDLVTLDDAGSNASSVIRGTENKQYQYGEPSPTIKRPVDSTFTANSNYELNTNEPLHDYQNSRLLTQRNKPASTINRTAPDRPVPAPRPLSRGPINSRSNSRENILDAQPAPVSRPQTFAYNQQEPPRYNQQYQPPRAEPVYQPQNDYPTTDQRNNYTTAMTQPRSRQPYYHPDQRSPDGLSDIDYTEQLRTQPNTINLNRRPGPSHTMI